MINIGAIVVEDFKPSSSSSSSSCNLALTLNVGVKLSCDSLAPMTRNWYENHGKMIGTIWKIT